ncbi:MAG TPA: hypothetical protein EYP85_06220 [Armatimonadetes bacterium]|nr:hypothetical protein [Armatimonadota bacterium]
MEPGRIRVYESRPEGEIGRQEVQDASLSIRVFLGPRMKTWSLMGLWAVFAAGPLLASEWRFCPSDNLHFARPEADDSGWERVAVGHRWRMGQTWAWLRTKVKIPPKINGHPTAGEPMGLLISAGEGGEIYVDGELQARYDNDHPGLALLAERAVPGQEVTVAVRVFGPVSGEGEVRFNQADLVRLDRRRVQEPLLLRVDVAQGLGPLPRPWAGISQGGTMADYQPATAAKLRALRPRWFRMDNVLTFALRQDERGNLVYDWTDFDRRVDFIFATGAEPVLCLSYMPIPLDAVPDPDRHSAPKDYAAWEELCYRAARRCRERGRRVKYWEVWNEANAGWLKPGPGEGHLEAYLKLYEASARGVKRADPEAWIGGPGNASGPWERSPERAYCVKGETFMRGLIRHCAETGTPLDFITWHEYFHPPEVFRDEMEQTREYLAEYPKVQAQVKEFLVTEWNFAWWHDWAQDHELGAAWAANCVLRAAIPAGIDGLCFFYAKDGDRNFRGSWGMLLGDNRPKPAYNAQRLFALLAPERVALEGQDGEVTGLASTDPATGRTTVLLLNYRDRYPVRRKVRLTVQNLPPTLRGGQMRRYLVDATHSNVFSDWNRAELEVVETKALPAAEEVTWEIALRPNALTLWELEG